MKKRNSLAVLLLAGAGVLGVSSCDLLGGNPGGNKPGEQQTQTHSHVFVTHEAVAATCLQTGMAAHKTCSECGKYFNMQDEEVTQASLVTEKLSHDPEHHNAVPATCVADGTGEYWTCKNEGDDNKYSDAQCTTVISSIPKEDAKGHSFGEVDVTWNGDEATATKECTREGCDEVITETKKGTFVEDKAATCHSAQTGHYEVIFDNTELGTARTDANSVTGEAATGLHSYGTPSVEWSGKSATATAICADCPDQISETKDGTFVEDTAATCCTAQKGHYEVEFDDARLGSARTDANSATGDAATGNHTFDYANKVVTWNGDTATATAACSTTGCTETVSEEKQGTYVKDSDATCTAPEKGHYEVEFVNTNFGTASTAVNSVENGDPHAHTLGSLIPQVDKHRDQDGMKAHYVCEECEGLFDEEENPCAADDLKIANTFGTFNANEDASYVFKSPLAAGSKVVFDFKINESSDKWINFCLMDNSWANHTEYITVYAGGNCKVLPGVTVGQVLEDGYIRVTVDTAVVPCEGTLEQIDFMYIRGATSNANGSFEYDPIGGTVAPGEKFAPGSYQYKLCDEVNLFGTVSTFDISFITEGFINFRFEELNWGKASKYIKLSSEGLLSDFREGVTVKEIANVPDGILARYRVTVDFNQIDKWSDTPLTSIGRLTIHPDITATGTIDVNNPNEYEYNDSIVVAPGKEYFFDKAYGVEEYIGLSLEYRMSDETAVSRVMLEDVGSYIGDLGFTSAGLDQSYQGVTAETLDDGFIKVTVIFGNVTRCGATWSTSVAAKNIKAIHSIKVHESWGTPGAVEIRNVQGINEFSLPNRGDKFSFAYPLDLSICRKLSFDYKLETDSDDLKTKVMFNANTGYVGDYGFKRNGPEQAYQGVTYESLGDGFVHVTIEFSKVNRANANWFSSHGWSSLSDGGINTITSIQTHSSWGDGCPITFRNVSVEKSARDARTFTAADYVDLPVKYTADELFGKALTLEYKLESGGTHSDYAHIVMMNTGWKNISGEIDLFGDATCNKGKIESLDDGWYKATIDVKNFNGDGDVRDGITNFRLEKFGGSASSLTIDWETLRVVDFDREYQYDAGGIVFKGITPIENWKTSGKKIVIECEKGSRDKGGQKFVFGLRDSNNKSVAQFTIRLEDHVAKKGNNGGDIFAGVQVEGNIYRYEIDLSLLDAMESFTGAESVVSINADETWMNMIVHSVIICDK